VVPSETTPLTNRLPDPLMLSENAVVPFDKESGPDNVVRAVLLTANPLEPDAPVTDPVKVRLFEPPIVARTIFVDSWL